MKNKLLWAGFFAIAAFAALFVLAPKPDAAQTNQDAQSNTAISPAAASAPQPTPGAWFYSLQERLTPLIAEKSYTCSIYVKPLDSADQPLVIHNAKTRAASMIKIFIMAEAFRQAKAGLISLDEECVITGNVKVGGSGILQGVPNGTRKTLGELIDLMIVESDNTATNMIIDRLSMDNVNSVITALGLKDTLLQRKMMDFESVRTGKENYTSVADLGIVLEKIYHGQCIGQEQDAAMLQILLRQEDNDKLPALLPSNIKVAHKTGELVGAIHDGGIVYGESQNYIVCIMTEDVNSPQSTVRDIANLSRVIYKSLNEY